MTKRLHAVNRWCVTGTPIQQGPEGNHSNIIIYSPRDLFLQDIYGLLLFLGVQPYCEKSLWKRLLYDPYVREKNVRPLVDVLKQLFWRTLKQDVLDEVIDELLVIIIIYFFCVCSLAFRLRRRRKSGCRFRHWKPSSINENKNRVHCKRNE